MANPLVRATAVCPPGRGGAAFGQLQLTVRAQRRLARGRPPPLSPSGCSGCPAGGGSRVRGARGLFALRGEWWRRGGRASPRDSGPLALKAPRPSGGGQQGLGAALQTPGGLECRSRWELSARKKVPSRTLFLPLAVARETQSHRRNSRPAAPSSPAPPASLPRAQKAAGLGRAAWMGRGRWLRAPP